MKNIFYQMIAFCMIALLCVNCRSVRKMQKEVIETAVVGTVTPSQLQSVNGKVKFDYSVTFASRQFPKKAVLKISPRMQYEGKSVALSPFYVQGERVKNSGYPVISYRDMTTVRQQMEFAFAQGMQKGILWADIQASDKRKEVNFSPVILNDKGVYEWKQYAITIDSVTYVPVYTQPTLEKVPVNELGAIGGFVYFPISRSTVPASQKNTAVMKNAIDSVRKVLAMDNVKPLRLLIYVSTSPDGTERGNKQLTANRLAAAKKYFDEVLGLNKLTAQQKSQMVVEAAVSENWEGLYTLLADSKMANKQEIIDNLKSAKSNAQREARLENYIRRYPVIKNEMLPQLRRADFFFFYAQTDMAEQEVETVYYMPQSDEQTTFGMRANWQLLNDMAVLEMNRKNFRKARHLLEAASVLNQDPGVLNNMGVAYAAQKNIRKAKEMFGKAQVRQEARYNMGLMLMMEGDCRKAVSYLDRKDNMSLAYCQLMTGDNDKALKTMENAKPKSAAGNYMKAVAAARTDKTSVMLNALRTAIDKNPSLRKQAASDVEFQKYWDNPDFKKLVGM